MKKLLTLLYISVVSSVANAFNWYDGHPVTYHVNAHADVVVGTALQLFATDIRQVTGLLPQAVAHRGATIEIVQANRASRGLLSKYKIPADSLLSHADAFYIGVRGQQIIVAGSNGRGTAYGILELSRMAGVSPWVWWNDSRPEQKRTLSIADNYETMQSPSVAYRGIFINDEDWSSRVWSHNIPDAARPAGEMGPNTYRRFFELLLRLRANTIWPAMHKGTAGFFTVEGNKAVADSFGIFVGTTHCEPMLRNNLAEWDVEERGRYNYITNRDAVTDYWVERLKESKGGNYLYTIGMRGIHDGPMEGVKTLEEKTTALQQVIDDQRELLARHVDKRVERVPQVFVPYKEVLQIMENGLRVPDDVTLIWCDDNYGYLTRLPDSLQQQRSGGSGVYYHLSYWGRPHDYLWLTTTQPGLMCNEMHEAYRHNARKLWIVNVHDVKVAAYDLELFLDMAWNIQSATPQTVAHHLEQWLCREFGEQVGKRLAPAMKEWYRLTAVRKPEFMGWTQVELDKRLYPRGNQQVRDTEFTTEFGNEMQRYLDDYQDICEEIDDIKKEVRSEQFDAYFSVIEYPLKASQAMAEKMIYAQKARADHRSSGTANRSRLWTEKSTQAYQRIQQLTKYYNNELGGGKWKGLMSASPRDLYVFYPPLIPEWVDDEKASTSATQAKISATKQTSNNDNDVPLDYIVVSPQDYASKTGATNNIQMLGHSMNALSISKGSSVEYIFHSDREGDATLHLALIPTQPNDTGDLRFSVAIDGGTPQVFSLKESFRSEGWKQNVLRQQALRTHDVHLSKGQHRLIVKALDNHIILDQMFIDFNKNRKFYMFPTEKKM